MNEYPRSADTVTEIVVGGRRFMRIAISSPTSLGDNSPEEFAAVYGEDRARPDDILVFSAQAVSIYEKNYCLLTDVKPSFMSKRLAKIIKKKGFSTVFSDERALHAAACEQGMFRFAFAVIAKMLFERLSFERLVGTLADIAVIDGKSALTFPPDDPIATTERIAAAVGIRTVIVDLRRDAQMIASTESAIDRGEIEAIMHDAPMRVGNRRVPMCIIREI